MQSNEIDISKLFGEPTTSNFIECPCCKGFGGDVLRIESSSARMNSLDNRLFCIYLEVYCTECCQSFDVDASGMLHSYRADGVFTIPTKDEDGEDTIFEERKETHYRFI